MVTNGGILAHKVQLKIHIFLTVILFHRHGIELLDRELRQGASKYKVHGNLLHSCGVAKFYLGDLSYAKDCFRKSIISKKLAEDFSRELNRKESLKNTVDKLEEAER